MIMLGPLAVTSPIAVGLLLGKSALSAQPTAAVIGTQLATH